jgi:hypothetical protein
LGEAWQDRTSKPGSGDEVLPPFRVGAGWRFLVWVRRRTGVKSTTKHAAGACSSCCVLPGRATPHFDTHTYGIASHLTSHQLTSPHSTSLTSTSQSLPIPLPPLPLPAVRPRSAYRKRLSKPALRGPRNTKLHVGITFRRATAIPWITPHSHAEFSSPYLRMAGATIPA